VHLEKENRVFDVSRISTCIYRF